MRLVSLTVSGYRQYLDQITLQIPPGLIGICGPNGVGKSKLIEAIGYALYGPASAILPRTDRVTDLPAKAGKAIPRVELEIEIRGQHYVICRTTRGKTSIQLHGATDLIADGASAVTQKVIELLRLTADAFCGTFVARQNEVAGLQSIDSNRRRRIVNRLIGITQVEHAIQLARETKGSRDRVLDIAQAKLQMSSAEAQQQLDEQQAERVAAIEARKAQKLEVEALEMELQTAQAQSDAIKRRQEQITQYQEMIQRLAPAETSAINRVRLAKERLETAQAAAGELADAEATIQQTAEVPIALSYYNLLVTHKNELQRQQRLADQLAQRVRLTVQLAEMHSTIEQIAAQIGEYDAVVTRAEADAVHAGREAEKQEHQRDTVARLGPDGVCDACGQILGDSYQQALQRHTAEAIEARGREQAAKAQAQAARGTVAALRQERVAKQKLRDELAREHALLDTVPGQAEAARDELALVEAQLAAIPATLRELSYDSAQHEKLRQVLERREEALHTLEQQRTLAAQEEEASQELTNANDALQALQRHRADLEVEIATTTPSNEEKAAAKATLTAAQKARERAEENLRESDAAVATAEERVRRAIEGLKQAQEQEQRIATARRDLFVAEQTEQMLQQLLLEITAEARPRIIELMETWMRALLGPRFHTIELTDDYQLRADNGSGLHPIGHFSGGEQTLLAIMLRVAISIFCRERAGFETSFLVLDEVFGNQDTEHRQQLVDFLNEIKAHYHQILIVNHIEDVTAMLDNIIDVVPTGRNTSRIQLR
jgi:DNA repair exonuclease SbcCD ATPase subunit